MENGTQPPYPQPNQPQLAPNPAPASSPSGSGRKRILLIVLAALLLGLIVLAVVLFLNGRDSGGQQNAKDAKSGQQKEDAAKKDETKDGTEDAKTAAGPGTMPATGDTAGVCDPVVSKATTAALASAVQHRDFAAIAPYMAEKVTVVLAASEKGGEVTPAQAIDDMNYLTGTTDPWDFNLSPGVTGVWAAHFYGEFFTGTFFAGRAASDEVVSFKFDECGKINTIFMAADYRLLEVS